MKKNSRCKLLTALLCLLMVATMLFTACTPNTPPENNEGNGENNEENNGNQGGETVDDKYVKLSDKGNRLYAVVLCSFKSVCVSL